MAHFRAINEYLTRVSSCLNTHSGEELEALLDVENPHVREAVRSACAGSPQWGPHTLCGQHLRPFPGWPEVLTAHLQALALLGGAKPIEAYVAYAEAVGPFLKIFRECKEAWLNGAICAVAGGLYALARRADAEAARQGRKGDKLDNCQNQLSKCFTATNQGQGNRAKKLAALQMVVLLFKVCFRLNKLNLCKNLMRTVESRQFLPFEEYGLPQKVAYKYYAGRLNLFNEELHAAEADLSYAFSHCAPDAVGNRGRLAYYLVPVRMYLGQLPTEALLRTYPGLAVYAPLVQAMRSGSLQLFNATLAQHQWRFIQAGTYLLLEKLRLAVFRRLFKRVARLHAEQDPDKFAQVPLSKFQAALWWQGVDMEMDEVECLVANLVYRKFIKGYLSHKALVAVMSKQDPFPPLATVAAADPL